MKKKKLLTIIPLIIFVTLVTVFIKDIVELWPKIFSNNQVETQELLESFGWRGVIYLILIQACQMLLVFIPSELIQVIAGATYGLFYGTLICWAGLVLGATIIYLLVNVFKLQMSSFNAESSNSGEIISSLNSQNKSAFYITLILFFMPAIPYGVICYFASGTNLNYFKYVLACLIGVLPSVLIDSILGRVAIHFIGRYLWPIIIGFILFMILVLWLTKLFTDRKLNKVLYGDAKPKIEVVLSKKQPRFSNKLYLNVIMSVFKIYCKKSSNVTCDGNIRNFQGQYIALSAHPSWKDFGYAFLALKKSKNPHVISNRYFFNSKFQGCLFDGGVISKKMFTNDVNCIRQIMRVAKNGESCLMMPEGRLSISGTNLPMPSGLGKLLKKLELPVLGIIPHGAYLTSAKWMKAKHKGMVEVESKVILTKEEVQSLSADEIEKKCKNELAFDEFEWIKGKNIEFKSKNLMKGIDGILYHCPKCHSEFTLTGNKNKIICSHCKEEFKFNGNLSLLSPNLDGIENVRDWYKYQCELEYERIKDENYLLECDVTAKTYNEYGKGLDVLGQGKCRLARSGFEFIDSSDESKNAKISCEKMESLLFGCAEDFETYINDVFYYFVPTGDKRVCVKWAICTEAMHKFLLENNSLEQKTEE